MTEPPQSSRSRLGKFAALGLIALLVVAFYATGLHRQLSWDSVRGQIDGWKAQVDDNLPLALLVFFLGYAAATALSLPVAAVLTLVGGALFGRWLGTGVASAASVAGATGAFLMSRYLLRDWVQARFGPRLTTINQGVEREGGFYLFTLRLVPLVPFFVVNLGMGLTPIRVGTFVVVSWAGMLLGTFLFANAGTELGRVSSPSEVLSPGVLASLALLGVAPLVIRKVVSWTRGDHGRPERGA